MQKNILRNSVQQFLRSLFCVLTLTIAMSYPPGGCPPCRNISAHQLV